MESIGYIVSKNFIFIAVDTNYETEFGGLSLTMNSAKKVYKLNDRNAICVIGNPYKVSDIHKYILKLNELGQNSDYDKILEDLNDVFNSSKTDISKGLRELSELLPKFYNETGYVKTEELFAYLKDKPEYISILQDTISSMNNSHPGLTQVLVFSWDKVFNKSRLAHFVSIGLNLTGNELNEMQDGLVYMRLASATVDPKETTKLESELVQKFTPLLQAGWNEDIEQTIAIINKGKEVLSEGLNRITPYKNQPNIVFYELSSRTNFIFTEPDVELKKIVYNRTNNDEQE